ncbi:uncharacterized protein LOC123264203 [Cotesia glomerata]|uniref:Transcription factor IIIC 90kDa subunit N-terminal domain-containing protein n=1 Tax=Cotesia glomerata TaxID=32391 RepID=A0AAV7I6F8_COTGL|nr:uncharacterized protein LOC123264203 [Cotesia glomerata]KAH0554131.1 hypothetical protein KQX54_007882 [Cotesia glomerata]
MEASDYYNLSLHELIISPFAVDWSQDNQISVITEKGVHILELQPNPLCAYPSAKFKRSFIYATDYLPVWPYLPNLNTIINEFSRNDLYSFLLDVTLTPKIKDKVDHIPRIVDLSWSPIKLLSPSKCLLAIVTSTGAIDITAKIRSNWYSIINLSNLWLEAVKDELEYNSKSSQVNADDADKFKSTLQRLCGTALAWSPLFQDKSIFYSYLLTGYRSSDLVIWKVIKIHEVEVKVLPTIVYHMRFDINVKITKLIWINLDINKYLIIVGFFDGRVYGVQINQTNNSIIQQSLYKYESTPDRMNVSFIQEFKRTEKEINIVIVKSYYLIIITVDNEGKLLRQKYIEFAGLLISGLTLINNEQLLISTQDSKMYLVTLTESDLITEGINHEMKASKVNFLGLAHAPSGATFVNVTSPNVLYDHLVNREPSTVYFFNFKGDQWDHWKVLNKEGITLGDHWDCLEAIRIRASRDPTPEQILPAIPEDIESLSTHGLRIVMWLTLITEVMKNKKLIKKIDNFVGEISEAQPLIFVNSATEFMIKIAKKTLLSNELKLCIHFLRLYMEVFLAGEDESTDKNSAVRQATDALRATAKLDLIEEEYCNLCGEMVTDLPWNKPTCPKGHQLPRCAITLLQITCLKYRNCPNCGRIFHPLLDDEFDDVKCLYCDIPAIYDNRIVSVGDEVEKNYRNLSLRPLSDLENSKMLESENTVTEKRSKKRKTDNGDTFTLIVNKNDETITETWQEF